MNTQNRDNALWWILRVGAAMCFIGHGMFGIITKEQWVPFFALAGISRDLAFQLMPLIGLLDIAMGISVLVRPTRAALAYMTVWALWTAALRPLTGDSVFEMLERAGNYGVPLALLLFLAPARGVASWFQREGASPAPLTEQRETLVWRVLSATTALLLVGHGALAMQQKAILVTHAGVLGFGPDAAVLAGAVEIAMAFAVVAAPRPALLAAVALWKLGTEMLWPVAGAPVWEFIERGGSYAAPLALGVLALSRLATTRVRGGALTGRVAGVAAMVILSAVPSAAGAQQRNVPDTIPIAPAGIFEKLQRGGYVIVCRHAATNHDTQDSGPAREQQRNLSAQGEEDARAIGATIKRLRIPIGDVRSTTVYRNQETAQYAFGSNVVDTSLVRLANLRAHFSRPVAQGSNRAIVIRQGGIYDALGSHGIKTTKEGDCFVIEPLDSEFRVLARLRVESWRRAVD